MNENQRITIANQFKNTSLGYIRIKKNLGIKQLTDSETEKLLREIIISTPIEAIENRGKNHYFANAQFNAILTINSSTLTVITAKKITKNL